MDSHKAKNKKKLFSVFKVYDYEKKESVSMMHGYKRNLTPIRENYQFINPNSPYENNFVVYSGNFMNSHFSSQYLNKNQGVEVTSKAKNFTTYSIVQHKQS